MSFNKIIVVGNLGRDPELRYTPQGTPVCSFTIASNEKRKDRSGETQDMTTWFKVSVWGRQGETASQYLSKGRQCYVEGRLRLEEWTDREGKLRHTLEIHATDIQFLDRAEGGGEGRSRAASSSAGGAESSTASDDTSELSDDDIPF
jgi:single-strand DNA-binding protein